MSAHDEVISKEILNLNNNKKGTFKNISAKRLKENTDICAPLLIIY